MSTFNRRQRKRILHERSNLAFEFPQSNDRVFRVSCPFLENPQVTEKGAANLANYDIIGRAGELFSYTGAKSRRLNLKFNISLIHVIQMADSEGIADKFKRNFTLYWNDKEKAQKLFNLRTPARQVQQKKLELEAKAQAFKNAALFGDGKVPDELQKELQEVTKQHDQAVQVADDEVGDPDLNAGIGYNHASKQREYYNSMLPENQRRAEGDPLIAAEAAANALNALGGDFSASGILDGLDLDSSQTAASRLDESINLIMFWVNLIRSSTLNKSTDTSFGPPIVRLSHGTMYDNVPCLVEDYDIRIMEEAGYEVGTLAPKRIEIQLKLIESRTGNFGKYKAGAWQLGDNVTGWESVITDNTIDPHNGTTGGLL